MLGTLGAAVAKDLRLLLRDRAGLIFLTLAPLVVITVAGLSLASLYGENPRGTSAYVLPFADLDGGRLGRTLAARLSDESGLRLRRVDSADEAAALVRGRDAGAALVIPPGTSHALKHGRGAAIELYTDPVKYLELAEVRGAVQELRHEIERRARDRAQARIEHARMAAVAARAEVERVAGETRARLETLPAALRAAQAQVERELARVRTAVETDLAAAAAEAHDRSDAALGRLRGRIESVRRFLIELRDRQRAFDAWIADAREKAGRFADRLPPPPAPPLVPPDVAALADRSVDDIVEEVIGRAPTAPHVVIPKATMPRLPDPPKVELPALPPIPVVRLPGALAITETSVTGAPRRLNTFDQNVPGFSVTFLLLGMLLGVSMGLLDERDWGTLARLRAMPTPLATILVAKLLARFAIGSVQMLLLFLVGRLAFGVSLGPEPWALALPTVGIVFAGTAFGLVVAGIAHTREAVLPVGSIVIVTMAAVGGCWWPIDLEPPWMRAAARIFPTTWAMAAFNDLMIRRQGLTAVLEPTAILFAFGLLYLVVGLVLFRRQAATAA